MATSFCPVCGRDVATENGRFAVHYNSGLLRCPTSDQPGDNPKVPDDQVTVEAPKKSPKKAAPRKKPAKRS
jgi:hypothetical protein